MDEQPRLCDICNHPIATYAVSPLCARCQSLSHAARLSITSERALAQAINRLAQALEMQQEDDPR